MRAALLLPALGLAALLTSLAAGCGGTGAGEEPPASGPASHPLDELLTLADLQAKGTHNSYHLPRADNTASVWSYRHLPLDQQLKGQGVRAVELDLNLDAELGRFEVFHVWLVDEESTCRLFTDCLAALRSFSDAHPAHHPILVQVEPKEGFDPAAAEAYFAALEGEILEVVPRERLLTPDDVQGDAPTLREAVASRGWPTLGQSRGKFLFFFDNSGPLREAYTRAGSDLGGRLLFVDSSPAEPYGAVAVLNDPVGDAARISAALAAGFLVRTRADSDSVEPLANDRSRLEAALASGAQIVTTDYPAPVEGLEYFVELPGGTPSRCNPVTAPERCTSLAIEDPAIVGP